jgi:uncharacterized protein YaiL (DUF2058 family)
MAKSLREQLLDAGLVDRRKLAALDQEKRKQSRQQPRGKQDPSAAQRRAAQAAAEKAARDRQLNLEREQAAARKALQAEVEQLIRAHRIGTAGGDLDFRFVHEGVIKTVAVTPEQRRGLIDGSLALVRHRRVYALVPREVAVKVGERLPAAVALLNDAAPATEASDGDYAGYDVPDDLMW